ncbi:MAG: YbaB/EbfC family nucleoid-associated protein [Planctomycetota bacterium]|jgi:DNA-binding YbaB/EbfC family protein
MFEGLKGMAGLAGLMKDLPRLKAKMDEVKQRLGQMTVSSETGGGAVRVTANGLLRVVSIDIDQPLLAGLVDPQHAQDRAVAEELIAGAVNTALAKARELAEREMASAAGELGLPLPPGGLGGLMT